MDYNQDVSKTFYEIEAPGRGSVPGIYVYGYAAECISQTNPEFESFWALGSESIPGYELSLPEDSWSHTVWGIAISSWPSTRSQWLYSVAQTCDAVIAAGYDVAWMMAEEEWTSPPHTFDSGITSVYAALTQDNFFVCADMPSPNHPIALTGVNPEILKVLSASFVK